MMKKLLSIMIFVLCMSLATTVLAGGYHGRSRYYGGHGGGYYCGNNGWNDGWEIAAAVLGTAIVLNALTRTFYTTPAPAVAPTGHWETQLVWVPGTRQRYWVNQYYDQSRNVWVLGHWEERPGTQGYWTQRQVWVAR